jgi:hypothetical protein
VRKPIEGIIVQSDINTLLKKNQQLTHSEEVKVSSHTQRLSEGWYLNTVMIEGYTVPFKFKRHQEYRKLTGARVNITYYPDTELVAGLAFEIMKVVRIKVA